ncbi:MAG: GAF domain-containing protein, partial [Cytophagales bacterium]
MIERLQRILKDPHKLSLLMAVLFCLSILLSAYFLFKLPAMLKMQGGLTDGMRTTSIFTTTFSVVAATFLLGVLAINQSMRLKRELIVYKEKEKEIAQEQSAKDEQVFAVDLQSFNNVIKNEKGLRAWQEGLNTLCNLMQAGQGALYQVISKDGGKIAALVAGFALVKNEGESDEFTAGEGLIGQAMVSGKGTYLDELPEGYQRQITSGLGMAAPKFLFIAPLKQDNEVRAILEVATFT